ncbi:DUF3566 domain-containing protein [Lipingzhangella sp. LS1_29]|uniref:DUF3566 domain-containing protein n=1 Tax=Lipingzhangella rawalii TaxID=2055835 RepID=A0ABU2H857_9ACTN|nr:DUF3566 domain-containing protein [Lipingzhangella rawalii]MDS1271482.1 DUF3566 domain-containing protein [Lipingzhangella rawalii]
MAKSTESQKAAKKPVTTDTDGEEHPTTDADAVDSDSTTDSTGTSENDSTDSTETDGDAAGTDGGSGGEEKGAASAQQDDSTDSSDSAAEDRTQTGVAGVGGAGRGSSPAAIKAVRRAHLTLSRVEPWSVMKFSFIVSLVCFIILFVAVAVIYVILASLGVFDAVTDLISSLVEGGEAEEDAIGMNPETWFAPARVLGYTGLIGALNIILITALATVGAMIYNLAADLVGGLDITLSEIE